MSSDHHDKPLECIRIVTLALNVPGPVAAARLHQLGAAVTKIEPPAGDPLSRYCPIWYGKLAAGQEVIQLDLKNSADRTRFDKIVEEADLLLTSSRPAALARLGLAWPQLHTRYPRLNQVAIVGYPAPKENVAGHDLTYQAALGLLVPPHLPRTLLADLASAERAVSMAMALLFARERVRRSGYAEVSLVEASAPFADPLHHGLTLPGALLGGGLPGYNIYRAQQGWIALAALEPHFWQRLLEILELETGTREELEKRFLLRSADDWEKWGAVHDIPIAAVRDETSMHSSKIMFEERLDSKEHRDC
jgi:crotonobetainyl-CoA:carnitine CoA-transferase CaiB-like acyl-CoA transferase